MAELNPPPPPPQRRRTDGARILIVEDSDDLRLLMCMALEAEGYRVEAARSAEEGFALMKAQRFDLLVSDYALPGRSGAWLLREATGGGLLEGSATLLVTAEPEAPDIAHGTEVIEKPVDFGEFLPQIRAILADGHDRHGRTGSPAPVEPARRDAPAWVELVLYVSPRSLPSGRALRVMHQVLAAYDSGQVRFRACDITEEPEAAAADRIIFTPTLLRRAPGPPVWVLGDLSRSQVVTDLLAMSGAEPVAPTR